MGKTIFFSHRIEALVDRLIEEMEADPIEPLDIRTIFVPNGTVKQWLLLEIAKRKGIAMGLKIVEVERFAPSSFEMFCLLYTALSTSTDPELQAYLGGQKKRLFDLTEQLIPLFFSYGQFGRELFDPKAKAINWQHAILQKLFVQGPWRTAVQVLPEMRPTATICFGIDFLPPVYWEYFVRAPSLSVYLFSPCIDFWEDLCSDRERRALNRYWEKKGVKQASREALDQYLRQNLQYGPRNLANWGRLGRETLNILGAFDLQTEEVYPPLVPDSLLKRVQFDLLTFQQSQNLPIDDSIQIFKAGSSRLKEIECLRDEILRLDVPYHEISVLAPDIEPYVPLIEFVFQEKIPYRISGFDIAPQSSFRQGLLRLFHLVASRWEVEALLTLFETPSFYRKRGWDAEKLEQMRTWITAARIRWGRDGAHVQEMLQNHFGQRHYQSGNSWEKGLDRLLNALVCLQPFQIDADLFEEWLTAFSELQQLSFSGEKTASDWAENLEMAARTFLLIDSEQEADLAAQSCFFEFLHELRSFPEKALFPASVIRHLLARPCSGQIHAAHLHAVRFAPLEEGALLPAKALFLIGMDEESFPRLQRSSSLNLLQGKMPGAAERDRYLFLQALFAATETLRISYCHLSADEGKPVAPSLPVQELLSTLGEEVLRLYRPPVLESKKRHFCWPVKESSLLPEGEITLSLSELRQLARHPWKFFLQKVCGMYLKEPWRESFALQKGLLLRATLDKPVEEVLAEAELPEGILGKALRLEILQKASAWKEQLAEWQLQPLSLSLQENCTHQQWEGSHLTLPPIEIAWDRLKVRLVGEVKQASLNGVLCANEDQIGGLLKAWPDVLAVACSLNAPQVWMLRSRKVKQIDNPAAHLRSFLEYYFCCLSAPSPLLPDWADAILRKGSFELKKGKTFFEDPILEWVLSRSAMESPEQMCEEWVPYLKEKFSGLIALYPTRSKSHAAV